MNEPRTPAPPTGLRRHLFRLPIHLYRLGLGGLMGQRFVLIHHVGRRSGLPREVVVEVVAREPDTGAVVVASGFGPRSDWYQNLLATPDVEIELGRTRMSVHAEVLETDDAGQQMVDYARRHPRAARSLSGLMGYEADGTEEGYRRVGASLPMVRLRPR
jgi:deazaflavin-dependent oxidoreductase (nitroreductase family)